MVPRKFPLFQTPTLPEKPLEVNEVSTNIDSMAIIIHDEAQGRIVSFNFLISRFLIKDGTQRLAHLIGFQAVILSLNALANHWTHLYICTNLWAIAKELPYDMG